jgi:hypothetical protein
MTRCRRTWRTRSRRSWRKGGRGRVFGAPRRALGRYACRHGICSRGGRSIRKGSLSHGSGPFLRFALCGLVSREDAKARRRFGSEEARRRAEGGWLSFLPRRGPRSTFGMLGQGEPPWPGPWRLGPCLRRGGWRWGLAARLLLGVGKSVRFLLRPSSPAKAGVQVRDARLGGTAVAETVTTGTLPSQGWVEAGIGCSPPA